MKGENEILRTYLARSSNIKQLLASKLTSVVIQKDSAFKPQTSSGERR